MRIKFAIFAFIAALASSTAFTLSYPEAISVGLFFYFLLDLIDQFGKQIVILHFFIVLALIQWLIMPIFAYHLFNERSYLATLWVKTMEVPSELYFSYVLPGMLAMILGFKFPLKYPPASRMPVHYVRQAQAYLIGKSQIGWSLIIIGLIGSSVSSLVSIEFGNVLFLLTGLLYCGILYLYYSDYPYKWVPLGILFAWEGLKSLSSGMFGGSLFLLINMIILLGLQWNLKFVTKLGAILVGFMAVILLQSVKSEFRQATWGGENTDKAATFGNIVAQKIDDSNALLQEDNLFYLVLRFNNGWQIARTMNRVPESYPFANGESIALSLAATAVPRVLWPDKPMSGGKPNLERFWGESYGRTSMNISPLGEGYANFDVLGGVIFMFFFGLLLNWCIAKILYWVDRHPTIICWLPLMFFSFYGVETDLMSILNSFFKGIIFTWAFVWLYKGLTGKSI